MIGDVAVVGELVVAAEKYLMSLHQIMDYIDDCEDRKDPEDL